MRLPFRIMAPLLRAKARLPWDHHHFLRHVTGVIHVGAHVGQERNAYAAHDLSVLWVEPIPEIFSELEANIRGFHKQRALRALVTEADGAMHRFHVSNNRGQSSSVFQLKHHRDVWPHVRFDRSIELAGRTLPSLLVEHGIDAGAYQALVLDTQGSEMLVLRGAGPLLHAFRYIKVEASDFELYEGCCQLEGLSAFLGDHGFEELQRRRFATRPQGGGCFDVVFARRK